MVTYQAIMVIYQYNGRFIIDMIINCYILIDSRNSIHVLCIYMSSLSVRLTSLRYESETSSMSEIERKVHQLIHISSVKYYYDLENKSQKTFFGRNFSHFHV